MTKILDYIAKGQGLGVKILLIFSLVVALIFGIYVKTEGQDLIPYAQQVADQMLPLKIENGVVVEPADTVRTASIRFDDSEQTFALPFVINTTTDTLNTASLAEGIYLTRSNLYSVQGSQARIIKLEGNFDLPRGDYTPQFRSILNWTALIIGLMAVFFCFVLYFLLSIFYSFCASGLAYIANKKLDFDQRMRLAVICLTATYVLFFFLNLLGAGESRLLFFLVVILLEAVVMKQLQVAPLKETPPAEEQK